MWLLNCSVRLRSPCQTLSVPSLTSQSADQRVYELIDLTRIAESPKFVFKTIRNIDTCHMVTPEHLLSCVVVKSKKRSYTRKFGGMMLQAWKAAADAGP